MQAPILILAGSIASGKSTLASMLEKRGAERIDCDALSLHLLQEDENVKRSIANAFGEEVFDSQGSVDRAALANRVFCDEAARTLLEDIEIPAIIKIALEKAHQSCAPLVVIEVPLLDRASELCALATAVVFLQVNNDVRLAHAQQRGISSKDLNARLVAQPRDADYAKMATEVFTNNGSMAELEQFADTLMNTYAHACTAQCSTGFKPIDPAQGVNSVSR